MTTCTFAQSVVLRSDNCCYRYCNKLYRVCSNGEVGCSFDEDCVAGVVCDTSLDQPKCVDIDECDIDNVYFNGSIGESALFSFGLVWQMSQFRWGSLARPVQ